MILQGNALKVLKEMDAESVSACVTSPPFWGLRSYGTEPQLWGGDDDECGHEWGDEQVLTCEIWNKGTGKNRVGDFPNPRKHGVLTNVNSLSSTCIHCGAWRGELGSEKTPEDFITHLCDIFDEVKRVLRKDGVCWVNMGDSYSGSWGNSGSRPELDDKPGEQREKNTEYYSRKGWDNRRDRPPSSYKVNGLKPKDLCLIPQRLAIELQRRGWWVRSFFSWFKSSAMPESAKDRPSNSHEWVIMLTRSKSYWYDIDAERVVLADSTLPREMRGVAPSNKWIGGADGQTKHTMSQPRESGKDANISPKAGRNLRTGDFMQASLDAEIEHARAYLASLHDIKRKGGIITDAEGVPVGLFCNPKGFKDAHFATFPLRFAEIFINLSVPAKCCAVCGKGWNRVMESPTLKAGVDAKLINRKKGVQGYAAATSSTSIMRVSGTKWQEWRGKDPVKQFGFRPDCDCNAPHTMVEKRCSACNANDFLASVEPCHKPGVVLDPFLGSGTTGMVAQRLGRQWIGIELSGEYAMMASKWITVENQLGMF